jgi:hypothetical protein
LEFALRSATLTADLSCFSVGADLDQHHRQIILARQAAGFVIHVVGEFLEELLAG